MLPTRCDGPGTERQALWGSTTGPTSVRAATGTIMNALDAQSDVRRCNSSIADLQYWTCASGTLMAASHVAGVIALMIETSKGPLTPDEASAVLTRTAPPLAGYAL